jgi:hypothetical protein
MTAVLDVMLGVWSVNSVNSTKGVIPAVQSTSFPPIYKPTVGILSGTATREASSSLGGSNSSRRYIDERLLRL